jgi:hypothetical protein
MRWLALAVVALTLAACGNEPEPAATPSPAPTTATPEPEATPAPESSPSREAEGDGIDPLEGASTEPATKPAGNEEVALLTDVRAARHEGYDRVVFEFRNELPGYDVRYVEPPLHEDGSGDPVELEGAHVVQVRMELALDADLNQEGAPMTYTGPQRFKPGTPEVVELARAGGFEGVLTWGIGLNDRVDFKVSTLTSPPRIVIDFRNH